MRLEKTKVFEKFLQFKLCKIILLGETEIRYAPLNVEDSTTCTNSRGKEKLENIAKFMQFMQHKKKKYSKIHFIRKNK